MRALTWHGKHDVRVDTVDDPEILNPRDATKDIYASDAFMTKLAETSVNLEAEDA